ncbi:hypothetical protein Asulf_01495 [Archaeoglobus sulfaticallidus PM70-1]|uniref:Uncharacterized protein n=1 Tax=Archaeoglobus sulfaticallidus PM70-1 TaxID=387631 RepID=N0BEP9_9EURY|nr:hypothetical protein [Archaeoglobus sulfaticallidus]AGK61478.1 hypothetical protein Asulf_01495 [Archaeoglobus sulfaticallidus PM70-1]
MLKCPYHGCKFKSKTLMRLIRHVRVRHPLNGKCPACGREFKEVMCHIAHEVRDNADEDHAVYYGLYSKSKGGSQSKVLSWARDVAMSVLEVDDGFVEFGRVRCRRDERV